MQEARYVNMESDKWIEKLEERTITYTLEIDGQIVVIENVPARVNVETGEQPFAPDTVERLQRLIREHREPVRVMQVPVYAFA